MAVVAIVYLIRIRKGKERIVFRDVQKIIRVPKIIRIRERVVEPKIVRVEERVIERRGIGAQTEVPEQDKRSEGEKLRAQLDALEKGRKAGIVGNEAYIMDKRKLKNALKKIRG